MEFTFRLLSTTPDDLTESEERICSSQFEELIGSKVFASRLKLWKGRIVALTTKTGTIYRLVLGRVASQSPLGYAVSGQGQVLPDAHHESVFVLRMVPIQWLDRSFYNSHIDDAVRFSLRIGFWGFIVGLLSILLSRISILKP